MIEINKILVPFDMSDAAKVALEKATLIAQLDNAEIYACHVANESNKNIVAIQNHLEEWFEKHQVKWHMTELRGSVYKEISNYEKDIKANLIVMGSHGVQGFSGYFMGSNAMRVVSAATCPVITLQETAKKGPIKKILCPLDHSEETRQKVPVVIKLAKIFGAEVVIFNVSKKKSDKTIRQLQLYANQVEEFIRKKRISVTCAENFGDNISEACIKYAKDNNIDLICMMTETESTNSMFMGGYAQQLVNTSPIPVVSIHSRFTKTMGSGY